ncbi:hypothetical protein NL676_000014 [Syzygium grande]|nr:hypothetical protein NL676_000014 [Syzygium grande]
MYCVSFRYRRDEMSSVRSQSAFCGAHRLFVPQALERRHHCACSFWALFFAVLIGLRKCVSKIWRTWVCCWRSYRLAAAAVGELDQAMATGDADFHGYSATLRIYMDVCGRRRSDNRASGSGRVRSGRGMGLKRRGHGRWLQAVCCGLWGGQAGSGGWVRCSARPELCAAVAALFFVRKNGRMHC